ncbi:42163_t:CDS:2, partial [Gigaspora margarita]
TAKDMGISIRNAEWKKNWTIGTHDRASTEIRNLLNNKDLFQKLEQMVLENKITRSIKEVFKQVDKINETQIKPEKRKLSHKRSKKEWVIGKKENSTGPFLGKVEKKFLNKKMRILEWEKANKENLSPYSPPKTSIVPTSKTLKAKMNEVEDVSPWIKQKNKGGWAMTISLKHLKNLIASKKRFAERKESKMEQ